MTLRQEITLLTGHMTVVAVYSSEENRMVVKELVSPDPRFVHELREEAIKLGLAPSKAILEANARTRGGTEELPWALLSNYSLQSQRTQGIIRRSFAEIFAQITLRSHSYGVDFNEISSKGRVRIFIKDTSIWADNVKKLSNFIE